MDDATTFDVFQREENCGPLLRKRPPDGPVNLKKSLEMIHNLGHNIAVAIAIHNIPEGLAAVLASIVTWFFRPLMIPMLGFAAGAMIFLVLFELIPDSLETTSRSRISWAFLFGFSLMALAQVFL